MFTKHILNRPGILPVVALAALVSSFSGRTGQAGPYTEAPMLRKLVEQGKLPPVEQRLPEQPAVVQPYETIGVYGGQMKTITAKPDDLTEAHYMVWEPLLRFASDGVTIVPSVVSLWQMSQDAKSITLYLREGMRWSDGVPVTVEDVLFAWYDVILNKDIYPQSPTGFKVGGKPMEVEWIDDFAFRLVFAEPYGAIPYILTRAIGGHALVQPKHYLKYQLLLNVHNHY